MAKIQFQKLFLPFSIVSAALAYYLMAYVLGRAQFIPFLLCFSLCFVLYAFWISKESFSLKFGQRLSIALRLMFLFSIPVLSDDYFRFLWDGELILNGSNPFEMLPNNFQGDIPNKQALLDGMNSPFYYSIYPPMSQLIYFIGAVLGRGNIEASVLSIRLMVLIAETFTIFFLPKVLKNLGKDPRLSFFYILNPLVILELSGNLHLEALMIAFLLGVIYFLSKKEFIKAGVVWALAASVKLIPLLLLPLLLRKLSFKNVISIGAICCLLFGLTWWPFYEPYVIANVKQSIDLYSKTFEFNAGLYYFLRGIGYEIMGYNTIGVLGPLLQKLGLLFIIIIAFWRKTNTWEDWILKALWCFSIYFATAIIVHPWYICTLVFLGSFTRFRFPMIWSGLVFFSYSAYQSSSVKEDLSLIYIEYGVVILVFLYEYFGKKQLFIFENKRTI